MFLVVHPRLTSYPSRTLADVSIERNANELSSVPCQPETGCALEGRPQFGGYDFVLKDDLEAPVFLYHKKCVAMRCCAVCCMLCVQRILGGPECSVKQVVARGVLFARWRLKDHLEVSAFLYH